MTQDKDNALLPSVLDKVINFYSQEIAYLESIKRTRYGDDNLCTYKKFMVELEAIRADRANVPQPEAVGVDVEGLKDAIKWTRDKSEENIDGVLVPTKHFWALFNYANRNLLSAPVVPDGYVLVPKEPTPEMYDAFISETFVKDRLGNIDFDIAYKAMIAAAPDKRADGGG
jgi:hypothetical protein